MKFALGQAVSRLEDDVLLCGKGRYADDFSLPRATHACFVRSPHAHARIKAISTTAAANAAGVVAILAGKDVAADRLGNVPCLIPIEGLKEPPRPLLAIGTVRHVGDPVAMVIAETAAQAKDAADSGEVDYEPLPASTDTRQGGVAFDIDLGAKAATEAAM